MQALKSSPASLPLATSPAVPPFSSTKAHVVCRRGKVRTETLRARAVTLNDLTLQRTEQKVYSQPAAEDTFEHPSQLFDDRQTLQGWAYHRYVVTSDKSL